MVKSQLDVRDDSGTVKSQTSESDSDLDRQQLETDNVVKGGTLKMASPVYVSPLRGEPPLDIEEKCRGEYYVRVITRAQALEWVMYYSLV